VIPVNGNSTNMTLRASIRMGEMDVAINDGTLRTLLGSCIGLALYDRDHKVAGLAHIVLPKSRGPTRLPGKFVDTAIPTLIRNMEKLVGSALKPKAKIAGGANMFSTSAERTIGLQNIEASERLLAQLRIPIMARHCGGQQGRRMSLDAHTGRVVVEIVGFDPIEL
jgi:chemotaxis protein CheD